MPPLTILVIGKQSGVPGPGFIAWDITNLDDGFKRVYAHDWSNLKNPYGGYEAADTAEEFAQKIIKHPQSATEIYRRIKVRGTVQHVFRRMLLKAYGAQCAVCGTGIVEVLEAAHIIPWSECKKSLRLSPKNGLLLCANHHKLFDKQYISIGSTYEIVCNTTMLKRVRRSEDSLSIKSLHGRKILLPNHKDLYPDHNLLIEQSKQ